jgi:hypothetical protein
LESEFGISGRDWFFEELDRWMLPSTGGNLEKIWLVTAEPGWGKSVLASAVSRRINGCLLWRAPYIDGSRRPAPWSPEEQDSASLVVIDGPRWLDWRVDLRDWVALQGIGCPVLVFARPHRASLRSLAQGLSVSHYTGHDVENQRDVALALGQTDEGYRWRQSSRGNFLIAKLIQTSQERVEVVVDALWDLLVGIVQEAPVELQADLYRTLCLLAEAGQPLTSEQMSDFLGLSAANLEVLLGWLQAVMTKTVTKSMDEFESDDLLAFERAQGTHHGIDVDRWQYSLFNPWLARTVSLKLRRDLEGSHASVIAFFRETFPSWEEMTDNYGWNHLGHHCDQYGRSGKKRDFSVLYWLTEGAYLKNKLLKTRNLPGVLGDIRRALRAALEEGDRVRIVHFGFMYPRLKREMAASLMHELADQGEMERSREHIPYLNLEKNRFFSYLLLAWQAAEEGQTAFASQNLDSAASLLIPPLTADDLPLLISSCFRLLQLLPESQDQIFALLGREENPLRTAHNFLMLGLVENLEDKTRSLALKLSRWSDLIKVSRTPEQKRIENFVGRSLRILGGAPSDAPKAEPKVIDLESFEQQIAELNRSGQDHLVVDALYALLDDVVQLPEVPDWFVEKSGLLIQSLQSVKSSEELLRAVALMGRPIAHLRHDECQLALLEKLAKLIGEHEDPPFLARARAELSVQFHRSGQQVRADALLSQAAGLAFQLNRLERGPVLKFLAGAAAQAGNDARARDLAFHAIEASEMCLGPTFEIACRGALRQGLMAHISNESSLEVFSGYAEGCRHQEGVDLGLRCLSLAAVAESANGLGYRDHAKTWVEQSLGMARACPDAAERGNLLAKVALSVFKLGDKQRYQTLLQEAMEVVPQLTTLEQIRIISILAECRHQVKDANAQAVENTLHSRLSSLNSVDLLMSRALLRAVSNQRQKRFVLDYNDLLDRAISATIQKPEKESGPFDISLSEAVDQMNSQRVSLLLAAGRWEAALAAAGDLKSAARQAGAWAEIAEQTINERPEMALSLIDNIPLRLEKLSAVLRCSSRLATELRPAHLKSNLRLCRELTLRALEDEQSTDALLSRWIQMETDVRVLEKIARKMNWPIEEPPVQAAPAPAAVVEAAPAKADSVLKPLTLRSVPSNS